jgi:hypothetical protein
LNTYAGEEKKANYLIPRICGENGNLKIKKTTLQLSSANKLSTSLGILNQIITITALNQQKLIEWMEM